MAACRESGVSNSVPLTIWAGAGYAVGGGAALCIVGYMAASLINLEACGSLQPPGVTEILQTLSMSPGVRSAPVGVPCGGRRSSEHEAHWGGLLLPGWTDSHFQVGLGQVRPNWIFSLGPNRSLDPVSLGCSSFSGGSPIYGSQDSAVACRTKAFRRQSKSPRLSPWKLGCLWSFCH